MKHLSPFEVISGYPQHDHTLRGLFETRTRANPARPFLLYKGKTWSWSDFAGAIDAAAGMLLERGIRKGDRVAIMATNSDAHVLLLFALARIGAIMVPVNPEFGIAEAQYVMGHAGVSAVACATDTLEVARAAAADINPPPWFMLVDKPSEGLPLFSDLVAKAGKRELPGDISAEDTCAIIYSSGTTGFPKGVMHSQRNFVLSGERHVARVHLQPDDRALCILPMFHINALFYSVAGTVAAGACLVIAEKFSASTFWRYATDTGATVVNVIMAVSTILARRPRSEFVKEHKLRLVTGAPFTREAMDIFKKEFGIEKIIEGFGMTEIPGAFSNPYDGPHKLASMGKPGEHPDPKRVWTEARVVDDDGHDVPNGTTGELVARVPTLMQGYYRDYEQTKAAFRDGWFLTGDLVRRRRLFLFRRPQEGHHPSPRGKRGGRRARPRDRRASRGVGSCGDRGRVGAGRRRDHDGSRAQAGRYARGRRHTRLVRRAARCAQGAALRRVRRGIAAHADAQGGEAYPEKRYDPARQGGRFSGGALDGRVTPLTDALRGQHHELCMQ
jgi:crotonobetaine/carnitine-CoA ligase